MIFKGSSASGRKAANSAEATLVFDNSNKQLALDSSEVHVTRRVYRSGEGEYLINNQACRLKDIRDLFRGTGVGVDAYSLIEQGKVDRMLQASPKDRRLIFEEAAGISRFNAKKAEAGKRLARVEQNLVRLKDIVDEVHTRLSSLKSQASKAQRYREMSSRLQDIRLQLGWTEYNSLALKSESASSKLNELNQSREARQSELLEARQHAQTAELNLHRVAEQCQSVEAVLQDALQRIAVGHNQQQSLTSRLEENRDEQQRVQRRLAVLRNRVDAIRHELQEVTAQSAQASKIHAAAEQRASHAAEQHATLQQQLAETTAQHDELRKQHVALLRDASEKAAELAQHKSLLGDLILAIEQTEQSLVSSRDAEQHARKTAEVAALRLKQIHEQNQTAAGELEAARRQLEENQILLSGHQEQAGVLQGRLEGAAERLEILQQLQQHLEGVDAGARHVLELKRGSSEAAYQSVEGLVADLLEVDVHYAPLIDTALGNAANALVVSDGQLFQLARAGHLNVPGRLSLIRLDRLPNRRFGEKVQLEGVPGILGRADKLAKYRPQLGPLFRYLLGTTWLVESLDTAMELGHFRGAGLRFVTADCQVIESDGTLTIGALQSSAGLVSRRSEIQDAQREINETKQRFQKSQGEIERVSGRIAKLKPIVLELEAKAKELSQEFAHQQAGAENAVGKLDELEVQAVRLGSQLREHRAKRQGLERAIEHSHQFSEQIESSIAAIELELGSFNAQLRSHQAQLTQSSEEHTAAKVELARAEQKLDAVTTAVEQWSNSYREREHAVGEAASELARLMHKQQTTELEILSLTSRLASDYLISETEDAKLEELAAQAAHLREERTTTARRLDAISRSIDKLAQQCESTQLDLEHAQASSQSLLKRFAEDFQIEFEQLSSATLIEDETTRQTMDAEASSLRADIASVGEINMAALAELDELQERYDYLNNQYVDLQAAKESLQRIIQKINIDSRRLFMETLEVIRTNFQKLYRKSFGGGNADIVLEDGGDVLECGIDIVATPPGKTALSNSLLSGGEKALTAVALLLAIFQYRPSPFCVLDEVDAPFDEANIGRFVSVLTEFLDWTKFIIVTHSKKTMTASTTLYGVTMQESGVSKQVAVRFEDVNEKGEILSAKESSAARRAA